MDWGFQNPNKTAALIVTLMFAVWVAAFVWRKGFWVSLALFGTLGVMLIHTFSRGGMAAFCAGIAILLWFAPRPWPRGRLVGGLLCAWLFLGAALYLQANQRFGQGMEDRSIANRLEIWREVPKMIADAPEGWGIGNAAASYEDWYQPLNERQTYRNLVSTHFTWLVEFNWWERVLYCFGWFSVGLLCWPPAVREDRDRLRSFVVPLAVWVAFFVTGIFSHVAESYCLWAVPIACLSAVLIARLRFRRWPRTIAWVGGLIASGAMIGLVCVWGATLPGIGLHASPEFVKIGNGTVRIWIVVNRETMGEHYGKALRRYIEEHPQPYAIAVVNSLRSLPPGHDGMVVVSGGLSLRDSALLHQEGRLLLVNPTFFPEEAGITSNQLAGVLFGEFSESPSMQAWQKMTPVKIMDGVGNFVASWPEFVLNSNPVSANE